MAKGKNNDLLPTLAGIFCLFVVFLMCLGMLGSGAFRLWSLLMPSLWLLLGLVLMTKRKNWLTLVGMLPLVILIVQGAWALPSMSSVKLFLQDLLCNIFPAAAFVVVFVFLLLSSFQTGGKFRREMWMLPILLMLPRCIWQHASTIPWAQFGVVACMTCWLKPSGK